MRLPTPRRGFSAKSWLPLLGWALCVSPSPPARAANPAAPDWQQRLDLGAPGPFGAPAAFQASYRMRWAGVEAARADVDFHPAPTGGEWQTRVQASTVGWARTLWQMDAAHLALARAADWRPVRLEHSETRPKRRDVFRVEFDGSAAVRQHRSSQPPGAPELPAGADKRFTYPAMRDLNTAYLYLRSLPLASGERHALVVMTATSPYLASVRVLGRGPLQVRAGRYPAIELDLGLEKVTGDGQLKKHKLFRSARVWLSDDADRLLLKAEVQIFIGSVSLELEQFTRAAGPEKTTALPPVPTATPR